MGQADNSPRSDTPGQPHGYFDSITLPTIDNSKYLYYLQISLPGADNNTLNYRFYYAIVEFDFSE